MKLNQPIRENFVFIIFDNWLISVFQGFVTRMELNTPVTRQQVLRFLLVVEVLGTIALFLVAGKVIVSILLTDIVSEFPLLLRLIVASVLVSNLLLYCLGVFVMYLGNKEPPTSHAPPWAVEGRRDYRFAWLMAMPGYLMVLLWWIDVVTNPELDVPLLTALITTFCFAPPLLFPLHEYTLCTKVLPPGEKERKKCEREMGNRTPAG